MWEFIAKNSMMLLAVVVSIIFIIVLYLRKVITPGILLFIFEKKTFSLLSQNY